MKEIETQKKKEKGHSNVPKRLKVGIVTTYGNPNYGSNLQSYALQYTLKKLSVDGYNLLFSKELLFSHKLKISLFTRIFYFGRKAMGDIIGYLLPFTNFSKGRRQSRIFMNYAHECLNESEYMPVEVGERIKKGKNDYDLFIAGSDQIWAPNLFQKFWFLDFCPYKEKKVAYASSIGLPLIPDDLKPEYTRMICDFKAVAMRELDGAEIVRKLTGREVPVVLDPTLLLTKEEWKLHSRPIFAKEPYILCLFLGANPEHREWVCKLKAKTGFKVYTLPMLSLDYHYGDFQFFVDPREFLSYIENASYVCTDSYHGILFSINYNKNFFAFMRFKRDDKLNQNSRVVNILEELNLYDRIVDVNMDGKMKPLDFYERHPIDYDCVNKLLDMKRMFSMKYLKNALFVENNA